MNLKYKVEQAFIHPKTDTFEEEKMDMVTVWHTCVPVFDFQPHCYQSDGHKVSHCLMSHWTLSALLLATSPEVWSQTGVFLRCVSEIRGAVTFIPALLSPNLCNNRTNNECLCWHEREFKRKEIEQAEETETPSLECTEWTNPNRFQHWVLHLNFPFMPVLPDFTSINVTFAIW